MAEARILVVDDETRLRDGLCDALEDFGFTTLAATSAEDALEMLLREPVDACTVDIRLPGLSGNEFILKAQSMRPGLKFIIYTGSNDYELPQTLKDLGLSPAQVFNKPCEDTALLAQALRDLLARGKIPS